MKKIMIIGAGMLQSYVIKRAKKLNYTTVVVDMDENAEGFKYADFCKTINIVDKEKCLKYAIEMNIDGVITAATDYGVITSSYIAEKLKLPGLDLDVASLIKNKYEVRKKIFEKRADDTYQFFEICNIKELATIEKEILFPVIVKPCDGSGSKGVARVDNFIELCKKCEEALQYSLIKKVLVETFVVGDEYGVESFVYKDKIYILGIMKKEMTKPPYYAELGHTIPSGLSNIMEEKIKIIAQNTIEALKINYGAVNMDVLVSQEGKVSVIDIGARMGGNLIGSHIIPLSTGIDYMGNIIKSALNDEVDFEVKNNILVTTKLLALEPGRVKEKINIEKYKRNNNYITCKLRDGDTIRRYKNNLDGCGYIVVWGDNQDKIKQQALDIKEAIDKNIIRE